MQQPAICQTEVTVQSSIQQWVKGRVSVAQPEHNGVGFLWRLPLLTQSHEKEEGEVWEPAENKGPQSGSQHHCGFVVPQDGGDTHPSSLSSRDSEDTIVLRHMANRGR